MHRILWRHISTARKNIEILNKDIKKGHGRTEGLNNFSI
jgi:hypothetical protein